MLTLLLVQGLCPVLLMTHLLPFISHRMDPLWAMQTWIHDTNLHPCSSDKCLEVCSQAIAQHRVHRAPESGGGYLNPHPN